MLQPDERKKLQDKPITAAVHKELQEVYDKLKSLADAEDKQLEDRLEEQKRFHEAKLAEAVKQAREEGLKQGQDEKTAEGNHKVDTLLKFLRLAGYRRSFKSDNVEESEAIEHALVLVYSGEGMNTCLKLAEASTDNVGEEHHISCKCRPCRLETVAGIRRLTSSPQLPASRNLPWGFRLTKRRRSKSCRLPPRRMSSSRPPPSKLMPPPTTSPSQAKTPALPFHRRRSPTTQSLMLPRRPQLLGTKRLTLLAPTLVLAGLMLLLRLLRLGPTKLVEQHSRLPHRRHLPASQRRALNSKTSSASRVEGAVVVDSVAGVTASVAGVMASVVVSVEGVVSVVTVTVVTTMLEIVATVATVLIVATAPSAMTVVSVVAHVAIAPTAMDEAASEVDVV